MDMAQPEPEPWIWEHGMDTPYPPTPPTPTELEEPLPLNPPLPQPRRRPFWDDTLRSTYERVPYAITPVEGWRRYAQVKNFDPNFARGVNPANADIDIAALPHLPLRPLMTNLDPDKTFSRNDLKKDKNYVYSRTVPVILTKSQKETLSRWFSGTRMIYNRTVDSLAKKTMPLHLSTLQQAFSTERTEQQALQARSNRKRAAPEGEVQRRTTRQGAGQRTSGNAEWATEHEIRAALEEKASGSDVEAPAAPAAAQAA